jgi:HTH-type transcriptional regulator/antitoxin HigA
MKTKTIGKSKASTFAAMPKIYAELVSLFMPRPLHDEVDYRNALNVLDSMAGFKMNQDQEDYFDAVATFVEKYESHHHPIGGPKMSPVQLIRSLMKQHAMSESDLGRLLGDRSLGHRILNGQRQLSKAHILVLSRHFSLNPAALL